MTFNEASIRREKDGKFGEKEGSAPAVSLHSAEEAIAALYEGRDDSESLHDLTDEQRAVYSKRAELYRDIMAFEREWAAEQGEVGVDEPVFNAAVQEKFGFSAIRYAQIHSRIPDVRRRCDELIAGGMPLRKAVRQTREELSGGKYHVSAPGSDEAAMAAFDRAEAEHERFEAGRFDSA